MNYSPWLNIIVLVALAIGVVLHLRADRWNKKELAYWRDWAIRRSHTAQLETDYQEVQAWSDLHQATWVTQVRKWETPAQRMKINNSSEETA